MSNLQIPPSPLSAQAMADLLCTILVCCKGQREDGKPFWAYLCIKPSMALAFKEARERGSFSLEDFGTVIEWGEGDEVPDDVKHRMALEYGANPDYESKLLQALAERKKNNS